MTSSGGVGLADFGDAYQHPQSINNNDDDEDEIPDSENDSLDSFKMVSFFRQIPTFIKVHMAFVFGFQTH